MNSRGYMPLGSVDGRRGRLVGEIRRFRESLHQAVAARGGEVGPLEASLVALAICAYRDARWHEKLVRDNPDASPAERAGWMAVVLASRREQAAMVREIVFGPAVQSVVEEGVPQ